jgi:putative FmdB family regulatory protein
MPIYEYRCDDGHHFEVRQRMADVPVETCITCERPVQRVFSPVAVHFKGSGFYSTDYGKRSRGEGEGESPAKSDAGGEPKKSGDGDGSSQSKGTSGEGKGSGGESKGSGESGSKGTPSSPSSG